MTFDKKVTRKVHNQNYMKLQYIRNSFHPVPQEETMAPFSSNWVTGTSNPRLDCVNHHLTEVPAANFLATDPHHHITLK